MTVGRPKSEENMTVKERRDYHKRMKKRGINNLSAEQKQAILNATTEMHSFLQQWMDSFEVTNPATPRRMKAAYISLCKAFDEGTE